MKPRISTFCVALLIIFLSWHSGGVTLEGRLIAIAVSSAVFILALTVITVSSSSPLSPDPLFLLPLTLIMAGGLVSLAAPSPAVGGIEFREILSLSLLAAAIILSRPGEGTLLHFYLFLLLWGGLLTIYGASEMDRGLLLRRPLTSTYLNRNHFAAFIGMILPLPVIFGVGSSKRPVAWLSRAGCLLLLLGLILTKSRGGLLGVAISIPTVLTLYYFQKKRISAAALLLICVISIIIIAGMVYFQYREIPVYSTSLDALSVRTRLSIWKSTLEMFSARPWTGWGWGTFRYVYPQFKDPRVWYTVSHAHNEFIQILGEGGMIGALSVMFCLGWSLFRLLKNYFRTPRTIAGLFSLGAAGSLIYGLVHAGFDFILRLPANALLLTVIISLGLASSRGGERAGREVSRLSIKLAITVPIILLLGLFVLYPMARLYGSYLQCRKGEARLEAGQPAAAREYFQRAIELAPGDNRPLCGSASAKMELFESSPDKVLLYRSILADLEKARRNNPRDLGPLRRLIGFHQGLSAYREAGSYLKEALLIDPTSPFLLMEMARNDLLQGSYKAAARTLNRAVDNYLCAWDAARKLIFSYTDDYEILKELPPPEDKFHRGLGYYLMAEKNWEAAEEEFRRAIALDPDNPDNWRAPGRLNFIREDYIGSQEDYEKALSLSPGNAQWWSELGDVLEKRDLEEKALDCHLRARDLAPANKIYPHKAAALLLQLKGPEAVLAFWEEVTEKNPGWARPYYLRAGICLETGDKPRAEREIGLALELAPENPYYLNFKKRLDKLLSPDLKPSID